MAIALVAGQTVSALNGSPSTTLNLVLTNNPTAGSLVIVGTTITGATGATCKDSNNNVYAATTKTIFTAAGGVGILGIFYLVNAPANATKTITITCTGGTPSTNNFDGWAAEYSGAATSSVLEADATIGHGSTSSSVNITSPSITSTNDGDLYFGVCLAAQTISVAASPFTGIGVVRNGNYSEYFVQTSHGVRASAFTQSPAGTWDGILAAFIAAAGNISLVPTVGSLSLSTAAPTSVQNLAEVPAAASLGLSGATPTAVQDLPKVPAAASLALTGNVPVESFSIVVPVGALTLSSDAPASVQNVIETPAAASLALTGNVPVELFSIQVPEAALTLSGTTSAVVQNLLEVPTAASLTLSADAPALLCDFINVPASGALALSSDAPILGYSLLTPAGTLALSSEAPASVQNLIDTPAAGNLALAADAPTSIQDIPASPASASLALVGTVPIIELNLVIPAGSLSLSADAPTVESNGQINLTPLAAALTLTGTFSVPGIPAGALSLSSDAPVASQNIILTPPAAALALSTSAPTSVSEIALIVPSGSLALASDAPVLTGIVQVSPTGLIWPWWWQQVLYTRNDEARGDVIYAWAELLPGEAKGNAKSEPDQAAATSLVIAGIATTDGLSPPRIVTRNTVLLGGMVQADCLINETEFVISTHVNAGIASICGYAPGAVLTVFTEDDEPQRIAA